MSIVAKGSITIDHKKLLDVQLNDEVISKPRFKLTILNEWKLNKKYYQFSKIPHQA